MIVDEKPQGAWHGVVCAWSRLGWTSVWLSLPLLLGCGSESDREMGSGYSGSETGVPEEFLFAWVTDSDSADLNFVAVIDADRASPSYGQILRTLPVPTEGAVRGHHTEHRMPSGGLLFANDFGTGKSYVLDLRNPLAPAVADSFVAAGPLTSPHSFERLPNGNVLATFQNEGPGNQAAGGLAELNTDGSVVRWGRGHVAGRHVRPYSLAIVPELRRVVTGSADMRQEGTSQEVQVWRLDDLELLATLPLPLEWGPAAEPRVLSDGRTVLLTTFGCKLLRIDGLDSTVGPTQLPTPQLVHEFEGTSCALPVVAGDLWIQAVPAIHGLVALDVSNPSEVREVSRVVLGEDDWPHWIALSPEQDRIVVTGYAGSRHRIVIVELDPATGAMVVDRAFGEKGAERPGISLERAEWSHGATGPGDPHGVVFSLRPESDQTGPAG